MTEFDAYNPAPEGESYRLAGFWVRFLAFIIDLLVITAVNHFIWSLLWPAADGSSLVYRLFHINGLFLGITGAAYFILMTYYCRQTLGKMILGLKVVQQDGKALSWFTVIFRELVGRSLSQLLGLNLGYLVCWFNPEKRCVHDLLSDTWVVYEEKDAPGRYVTIQEG